MKRFYTLLTGLLSAAVALTSFSSGAQSVGEVRFYAPVTYSGSWYSGGTYKAQRGIYTFTTDEASTLQSVSAKEQWIEYHGGAYANGYYYFQSGVQSYGRNQLLFNKMNVADWTVDAVDIKAHPDDVNSAYSFAYDYISGKMYASCPNVGNTETPYMLREVPLDGSDLINIAPLEHEFSSIAFDGKGQLWGIDRDRHSLNKSSLYKIDTATGKATLVGETGYNQRSEESGAVFDIRTGKLYWYTQTVFYRPDQTEGWEYGLFEIDTTNGKATKIKDFSDSQDRMADLFMINNHPAAPATGTLEYTYTNTTFDAVNLTYSAPSTTYDGSPASGNLSLEFFLDGKSIGTKSITPGSKTSVESKGLARGNHKFTAIATDSNGRKSLAAEADVYAGSDKPSAVTNIKVVTNDDQTTASISWDAPTVGVNGGAIESANLSYKVVVNIGRETLYADLKDTHFDHTPLYNMALTQYQIIPVIDGVEGTAAYSTPVLVGAALDITATNPYLEAFNNSNAFSYFTVIDANNDRTEAGGNVWLYNPNFYMAAWWWDYDSPRTQADDWLITPSINFDNKKVYRISFDVRGFSGAATFITDVNAYAGKYATAESMNHLIASFHKEVTGDNSGTHRVTALFKPNKDERRVGFHASNNGYDHIGLDNILIEEYGPYTIPAAPTDLKAVKEDDGSVTISATLPTLRANNMDLLLSEITKVEVYNVSTEKMVATLTGAQITSTISVVDKEAAFAINQYRICAYNSNGCGMEGIVEVDMVPDTPKDVTNIKLEVLNSGRDARLTWEYPADMLGANGLLLRPEEIYYTIERQISTAFGSSNTTVARIVRGNEYTDVDVDAAFGSVRQGTVTYTIIARTVGGSSYGANISDVLGRSYELPAWESGNSDGMRPWQVVNANMGSWYMNDNGYSPKASSQDGGVGLLSFSPSSTSRQGVADFVSPRINLSGLLNPKMTFWIYQGPNLKDSYLQVGVITVNNGLASEVQLLPGKYCTRADVAEEGWYEYSVDLSAYAKEERASIVLRGSGLLYINGGQRDGNLHVDNITISGDKPENDIRITNFSGAIRPTMGKEETYSVVVENNGKNEAKDVEVQFFVGGELFAKKTVTIAVNTSATVEFDYTAPIAEEGTTRLIAKTLMDGDLNLSNNEATLNITTVTPLLRFVNDLSATVANGKDVNLSWSDPSEYPAGAVVMENFTDYTHTSINNFGGWTTYDGDRLATPNGISNGVMLFTWTNSGEPQAFMVFNPKRVGISDLFSPNSGEQCLVAFNSLAGANDDWLISPQLSGNKQTINFYAMVIAVAVSYEYFETYYSTSGNNVEDFVQVGSAQIVNANIWRPYSFEVPAGAKYFAIRCVTKDKNNYQFGLALDDFEFTPAQPQSRLEGFNIYRDGKLIESDYPDNDYTDKDVDLANGVTYQVTAVHAEGESVFSNLVTVSLTGIDNTIAGDVTIRGEHEAIVVEGAQGANVAVYTVDGRMIYSGAAAEVQRIPAATGLYIVRAGAAAAKVLVK